MANLSLAKKAEELTSTISAQQKAEGLSQVQETLEGTKNKIASKKGAMLILLDKCEEVRESTELAFDRSACLKVKKKIDNIIEQNEVSFDANSIADAQDELDTVNAILRSFVQMAWKEIIGSTVKNRSGLIDLVSSFSGLSGADDTATKISKQLDEISNIESHGLSPRNLARLKAISSGIEELLKKLFGDDESVQNFANSIAKGGARIDQLTPEVLAWLSEKGFIDSFKIVPGFAHSEDDE